jgi:hypothetical protein
MHVSKLSDVWLISAIKQVASAKTAVDSIAWSLTISNPTPSRAPTPKKILGFCARSAISAQQLKILDQIKWHITFRGKVG